jgi:hypothetical protein
MGEVELLQALPILGIERLVSHLLQQCIEGCGGADGR